MASKRRFELEEGTSNKFWEVTVAGDCMTVCYGRTGTAGVAKEKSFDSPDAAKREAARLIAEKTKKGYVEVTRVATSKAPAKPAAAKPPAARPTAAKPTAAKPPAAAAKPAAAAPKSLPPKRATRAPAAAAEAPGRSVSPAVDALLELLREKHKHIAAQLRPAASSGALELLRAHAIPAALLALYAAHDGTDDEIYAGHRLLPIAEIESTRSMMNGMLAEKPEWKQKPGAWNEHLLPFMADGDGQLYCVDRTGSIDGGTPGQIVFYDHETGAVREFGSFDVMLELLTALAKKGLLDPEAREQDEALQEKYDELYADAKNVGMPRMPARELKKVLAAIEELNRDRARLDMALAFARRYPAEVELWRQVVFAADALGDWPLVVEAAGNAERLTPARDRPNVATYLAGALHRLGRDEQALAAVTAALSAKRSHVDAAIPEDITPAFRHRCLQRAVELRPRSFDLWLRLGSAAPTPTERAAALEHMIELCSDADLIRFNESRAETSVRKARVVLELDRVEALTGAAKLKGLLALARLVPPGESRPIWERAVACAVAQADWRAVNEAGAGLVALNSDDDHYLDCRWQVLALHRLGRDDEALELLREALAAMYDEESEEALRAVPWTLGGAPPHVERAPGDDEFEARCHALAVEVQPDNPFAWSSHARTAPSAADRKAALHRVVALCVPKLVDFVDDPGKAEVFVEADRKKSAAARRIRDEAVAGLAHA